VRQILDGVGGVGEQDLALLRYPGGVDRRALVAVETTKGPYE
jgi:hypothetical protein